MELKKEKKVKKLKFEKVYTDGACEPNPGNGGWGFVIIGSPDIESYGGELDTTSNRMELLAIIKALEYFNSPEYIKVFSDSRYAVNGFNDWMHTWRAKGRQKKNMDLWDRLFDLKEFHKRVEAIWVKGHNDDKYNDLADELSIIGMEETISGDMDAEFEKRLILDE
ncbi:Ribonuclease HI [subsurface metagenome]